MIKNHKQLASSPAAKRCLSILEAGMAALDPEKAIRDVVRIKGKQLVIGTHTFPLNRKIIVVGAGKASGLMAQILEKILGNKIRRGLVIDTKARKLKRINVVAGDHPVLSPKNVRLTKKIFQTTNNLTEDDLVICLISGGGSALFADPHIPLSTYQKLTKGLLRSGANIQEVNTIRKHVDGAKGGRFAAHCYPATVASLLVSDVPGNDPAFIASGPTVYDKTTLKKAQKVLRKYGLPQVSVSETPKEAKFFKNVHNIIVLDNEKAVNAMKKEAVRLKLKPKVLTTKLTGEARLAGIKMLKRLKAKRAVIAAGETTVTVRGKGIGGRNQELVLGALEKLSKMKNTALASMGTDGIDNSDHAGAIADEKTLALLDPKEFLKNNNSYVYWKKTKHAIITGVTGTNVADIMVAVRL